MHADSWAAENADFLPPQTGMCSATTGQPNMDGDCGCTRPAGHDGRHRCGCGYTWGAV